MEVIDEFGTLVVAVDFDGVMCENAYPNIGKPNWTMISFVNKVRRFGGKCILWTCREGYDLKKAKLWLEQKGCEFDAYNENLPERIEEFGNDCRKVGADFYIDDKNITQDVFDMIDAIIDNNCEKE